MQLLVRSIVVFALMSVASICDAQTVITNSYTTLAACAGGTSHTGPPIILCAAGNNYILGSNITPNVTDGIDLTAPGITLDMSGYVVKGTYPNCTVSGSAGNSCSGAPGSLVGIKITASNVTVKNGGVSNINGTGIVSNLDNVSLQNLQVHDNHGDGVDAGTGVLKNIQASANEWVGIYTSSSLIDGSIASYNNTGGIISSEGVVTNSIAIANGQNGFLLDGIGANNFATRNSSNGFYTSSTGIVQLTGSLATGNGANGFNVDSGGEGTVTNSNASGNSSYGFNLSTTTCYLNLGTFGNSTGTVTGGTTYGAGTVCAH